MGQFSEQPVVEQFFKKSVHFFITIYATLVDTAVFHRSSDLLKRILSHRKCTEWGKAGTRPRAGVRTIVH